MKEEIKKLKDLIAEFKEIPTEHIEIDTQKKILEITDIFDKLYEHVKWVSNNIEMSKVMYYERKMNNESGKAYNELKGEGSLIGLGTENNSTSAIIKTEKGEIINHPLNLVKFINICK